MRPFGALASGDNTERKKAAGTRMPDGHRAPHEPFHSGGNVGLGYIAERHQRHNEPDASMGMPRHARSWRSGFFMYVGSPISRERMLTPPNITVGKTIRRMPAKRRDSWVIHSRLQRDFGERFAFRHVFSFQLLRGAVRAAAQPTQFHGEETKELSSGR